MRCGQVLAGD